MRNFYKDLGNIRSSLQEKVNNFRAGQIRKHLTEWERISNDDVILNMVKGVDIDFAEIPVQTSSVLQPRFSREQTQAISDEVQELLKAGVVTTCEHSDQEYISPVFVRPKKDNKLRMILNLKQLNKSVEYHHFKMETLNTALALVTKDCWFASLDLKSAYFSVHINEQSQEFLKFLWEGQLYKFTVFPNGLACCPRLFTKLLKPVMAFLHQLGFISTIFIDDSLLIGDSELDCVRNIKASLDIFQRLGFVIHPVKSELVPSHSVTYLGFVINSQTMTVTLTQERKEKILDTVSKLLDMGQSSIRLLAKLIGMIVASFQGVMYGALWYRNMERDKIKALGSNGGDYEASVVFFLLKMNWWKRNIMSSYSLVDISHGEPDFVIYSDASLTGWGCSCSAGKTGGHWNNIEAQAHINVLELKAGFFALKSFIADKQNIHVRLFMDNTTAVACIENRGSVRSVECDIVTKDIWLFCIEKGIWISAAYVPGKDNVVADELSRRSNLDTEWQFNINLLQLALGFLGFTPDVDLFASRINRQFPKYVSYQPDPEAAAVNAFSLSWSDMKFYCFPPFCIIPRILQKITREKAIGVIVVPFWPSQPWFPRLAAMWTERPVLVVARENLLSLPEKPEEKHRLRKTLQMIICKLSGKSSDAEDFRNRQAALCAPLGDLQPQNCIQYTSENGRSMLVKGVSIPFIRL